MIDGLDEPAFRSLHNSVHFMIGGDAQSFNWCVSSSFVHESHSLRIDTFRLDGTPWNGKEVFGANDPLFVSRSHALSCASLNVMQYLHHANVDHVFWEWQNKAEFNQYDYSGREGAPDSFCDALPTNSTCTPRGLFESTRF